VHFDFDMFVIATAMADYKKWFQTGSQLDR
jgi:hypothetical protein